MIKTLPNQPDLLGMAEASGPIVYREVDGQKLTLHLITPWNRGKTYPLVVFIQGSGWTSPNRGYNLPHICDLAREGFVVATVTHRSANDGHPFPAFLQDVKSAIRFLRAHAEEYCIDPMRVAAYGTSSGGNTSLLLGLTANDPRYLTEVYPDVSDEVCAVVDCFGPTDMDELFRPDESKDNAYYERLIGHPWDSPAGQQTAMDMSPIFHLKPGMYLPPMLLLYGNADTVVPFEQGERMYMKMQQLGYRSDLVIVTGAEHEGNFWSAPVREEIIRYLKENV